MAKKAKAAKTAKRKTAKKAATKARAPKKAAKKAKPAKKPATKKTKASVKKAKPAAKKSAKTKVEVYTLGRDAPGQRYFILANGHPVKHVAHLAEILDDLEDHVFDHHVNPERNDFHTWVKDVFKDVELAKKMLGVNRKEDLQLVIYKHAAHKAWR